ncbi:hypothetical protein NOCA2390049 [metagenome]|uniref:Uncharacterized protein n=1 Tax=metagenome TaxID=256318 RepID=A0A2P2C558_9ZZZZ
MIWVVLGVTLAVLLFGGQIVLRRRREVERLRLARQQEIALLRRVASEDVEQFGEELAALNLDASGISEFETREDYQAALEAHESARSLLGDSASPQDISGVTSTLERGRHLRARVLARLNGQELPEQRPPCFFNPAHGPARADLQWAPRGGTPRSVPVCLEDVDRLSQGGQPEHRLVRSGSETVPWFEAGPRYAAYAQGYYAQWAEKDLFPTFILGQTISGWNAGGWMAPGGDWRLAGYGGGQEGLPSRDVRGGAVDSGIVEGGGRHSGDRNAGGHHGSQHI